MQNFKSRHIQAQAENGKGQARESWAPPPPDGRRLPRRAPGKMDLEQNSEPQTLSSAVAVQMCTASMVCGRGVALYGLF